jgi:hypothetical protein
MKSELEQIEFDYRDLSPDDRGYVKQRADCIRDAAKKTAQGIILIGQWLSEAKAKLKHGQWGPWHETEFGWQSAQCFALCRSTKRSNPANWRI